MERRGPRTSPDTPKDKRGTPPTRDLLAPLVERAISVLRREVTEKIDGYLGSIVY